MKDSFLLYHLICNLNSSRQLALFFSFKNLPVDGREGALFNDAMRPSKALRLKSLKDHRGWRSVMYCYVKTMVPYHHLVNHSAWGVAEGAVGSGGVARGRVRALKTFEFNYFQTKLTAVFLLSFVNDVEFMVPVLNLNINNMADSKGSNFNLSFAISKIKFSLIKSSHYLNFFFFEKEDLVFFVGQLIPLILFWSEGGSPCLHASLPAHNGTESHRLVLHLPERSCNVLSIRAYAYFWRQYWHSHTYTQIDRHTDRHTHTWHTHSL